MFEAKDIAEITNCKDEAILRMLKKRSYSKNEAISLMKKISKKERINWTREQLDEYTNSVMDLVIELVNKKIAFPLFLKLKKLEEVCK